MDDDATIAAAVYGAAYAMEVERLSRTDLNTLAWHDMAHEWATKMAANCLDARKRARENET